MIEKPLFSVFGVGKMIYPRIKKRYERKINQNDSFAKGETIFAGNKMKIKNQTRIPPKILVIKGKCFELIISNSLKLTLYKM
jgi:hypothetical protein